MVSDQPGRRGASHEALPEPAPRGAAMGSSSELPRRRPAEKGTTTAGRSVGSTTLRRLPRCAGNRSPGEEAGQTSEAHPQVTAVVKEAPTDYRLPPPPHDPKQKATQAFRSGLASSRRTQSIGARLLDAASCLRPTGALARRDLREPAGDRAPRRPGAPGRARDGGTVQDRPGDSRRPAAGGAGACATRDCHPRPPSTTGQDRWRRPPWALPTVDRGVASDRWPGTGADPVAAQRPWLGGGCWAVPRVA
jgi:hypothetical protein